LLKQDRRRLVAAMRALLLLPFLLLLAAACSKATEPAAGSDRVEVADGGVEEAAIRRVVADMEAAWNRGDFAGYMAGFKRPDVVFVSKGEYQKDWQGTLDHYVRDYGGGGVGRRGRLHFWDLRIERLAPDAALLTGRYRLEGGDRPQDGINTRLFRKVGGKWVIAMNHVSSKEAAEAAAARPR
jgi:ketosteroid isomerase-like protein